jgi:hypothetical protein
MTFNQYFFINAKTTSRALSLSFAFILLRDHYALLIDNAFRDELVADAEGFDPQYM